MDDPKPEETLKARVQRVVDEKINPALASHGGFMVLVDVQGTVATIQMGGGCQGCGMATMTLRYGIERVIQEAIPEITEVRDVSDHAAGTDPYELPG